MTLAKSIALCCVLAPLALAGCRSDSDFTGYYNFTHPPQGITDSTRFKIEKTDSEYVFVPIVNNQWHQCIPNPPVKAHLATKDELIRLTDQQDPGSIQALTAPSFGVVFFGPKDTLTMKGVHGESGTIINIEDGNGLQEATRTKNCVPFLASGK